MWNKIVHTPLLYIYLLAGVVISVALGFYLSSKIFLPVFQVAVSYPVLFYLIAEDRRNRAFAGMLFWALCLAIVTIFASIHFPARAELSILHGQAYVQEMFHWIQTGEGAEGNPMLFIPQHLLHFVVFCILSALTASLLSLVMGAVLMNYMSYYVAAVIRSSTDVVTASIMGWHPWAIVRVISYVILGVILGEPLICKIVKKDYEYEKARPFFWAAITGVALDILMKSLMAPWWGLKLRAILR